MKLLPLIILAACVGVMAGCAHNKVVLKVDIFGEDPRDATPLSLRRIEALREGLDEAQAEGRLLVKERTSLAQRLFTTYTNFYKTISLAAGNKNAASELQQPHQYLASYLNVAQAKNQELEDAVRAAVETLDAYAKGRANPTNQNPYVQIRLQSAVHRRLEAVSLKLLELAGSWGTAFEKSILPSVPKFVRAATPEAMKQWTTKKVAGAAKLSENFKSLQEEVEKVHQRRNPQIAAAVAKLKLKDPGAAAELFTRANALVERPGLSPAGENAFTTLYNSHNGEEGMIRDWGDPVWRTLTDPENAGKWHRTFTTNYFYAEGNSSVVIVRDSPVDFRVQKGDNNPTALIQSQLQITRSIADTAISIAGAASGVPIPKPHRPAEAGEPAPSEPNPSDPADDFNARRSAVDVQSKMRGDAIRMLRLNLAALRKEFEALNDGDDASRTSLLLRLESTLNAHALLLQSNQSK